MRVLVTGGTGAFGQAVSRQLVRVGAEPLAMARNQPHSLPRGVRYVAGDVRDPDAVDRALTGCDAVVHLAWFMGVSAPADEVRAVNLDGTRNLLEAMERTGCRRIVFSSSTTSYGTSEHHPEPFTEEDEQRPAPTFLYADQKRQAEELIAETNLDAVVARVTVVLGRSVDNGPSQAYTLPTLIDVDGSSRVQVVHQDDVGRFLAEAAVGERTGTVNLASPGSVSMRRAGELLGRRVVKVPLRAALGITTALGRFGIDGSDAEVARALAYWPVTDTNRLTDDWGFQPVWGQEDALRDQARSASRVTYLTPDGRRFEHRRRLPWAVTDPPDARALRPDVDWQHAAPEGIRGERDSLVDPDNAVFSATNLSEAFPGPMTPLSLDLAIHGMSAASDGIAQLFAVDDDVRFVLQTGIASFGHCVYTNVSAARVMAQVVPGATVDDVDRMYLGIEASADAERPSMGARELLRAARMGGRVTPRVVGYTKEVDRLADEAMAMAAVDPTSLDDPALVAHLELVHDLVCQGWTVSSIGNFLISGLSDWLEDGDSESTGATALRGVERLAAQVRRDPALSALPAEDAVDLERVRGEHPSFGRAFDQLLEACGHRGPGETELENEVYADQPELVLDVILRTARAPGPRPDGEHSAPARRRSPMARLARTVLENKERARDAGVRLTHAFRLATRERGRRLAIEGLVPAADDVFYLTYDELLASTWLDEPPIAERRAERSRLATYAMPLSFERSWSPVAIEEGVAAAGDVLRGVAAVSGRYEGTVRVMQAPTDELEPGDVLVAATTDIGWTPYFALAGAIVTDVGGVASHSAIVAREHGIPSVVGTESATTRLRSGMQVAVDGEAGTVEVLGPS